MTWVVDASVALKWFLRDEPDADRALNALQDGSLLTAPDIIISEVCNAAWKSARLGRITQAQVTEIATVIHRFFDAIVESTSLIVRAVEIAERLDHPVYDCLYVALAEAENAYLITADSRLQAKVGRTQWKNRVVLLANHPAPSR